MADTAEPECTCKITRRRTVFDPECYYHGDNGTMVARIRLPITQALEQEPDLAKQAPQWLKWHTEPDDSALYAMPSGVPDQHHDIFVGRMASSELAAEVVASHNATLEQVQR